MEGGLVRERIETRFGSARKVAEALAASKLKCRASGDWSKRPNVSTPLVKRREEWLDMAGLVPVSLTAQDIWLA